MTTYVLVPGAGGEAWYWSRVVGELTRRGHEAIAVDLPAADESAGLAEYVDVVVAAAEGQDEARPRNDEEEGRSPDGEFDPFTYFLHDVPPDVLAEAGDHDSDQSGRPFEDPWPLDGWPDVLTRVASGRTTGSSRSSSSAVCRRSGWA